MKIVIKSRAQKSISNIAYYISKKGYPGTSVEFITRPEEFINSLSGFPDKYPVSRHKAFAKRKFRQAIFERNYIILYKVVDNELIIFNVIHAGRIR